MTPPFVRLRVPRLFEVSPGEFGGAEERGEWAGRLAREKIWVILVRSKGGSP